MRIQESAVYSLLNLMHLKIYKGLGVAGVAGVNWELQYLWELRELHYVIGPNQYSKRKRAITIDEKLQYICGKFYIVSQWDPIATITNIT